jgi:hypothetical protein
MLAFHESCYLKSTEMTELTRGKLTLNVNSVDQT